MLKAHIDSVEGSLLATSQIAANTGHSLHKGTPREAFIRQFLEGHLSERVAVGTGEVIDATSQPNPPATVQRPQFDIVLYKRDYPRLDIGGGISAFLAESVVATIEVKSTLDADDVKQAMRAASYTKKLTRNTVTSFHAGFQPPSVLNYVVAYDGPAKMSTVHSWVTSAQAALGIRTPILPLKGAERGAIPSPSVDGIMVLGNGFVAFDNFPIGFVTDAHRQAAPTACWNVVEAPRGSLLLLFLHLTTAISGVSGSWLNPLPYLSNWNVSTSAFLP